MDPAQQATRPPAVLVVRATLFKIPPQAGTTRPYHLFSRLAKERAVHFRASLGEESAKWPEFVARPEVAQTLSSAGWAPRLDRFPAWRQVINVGLGRSPNDLRVKDPAGLAAIHKLVHEAVAEHGPLVFLGSGFASLQLIPQCYWQSTVIDSVDAVAMLHARRLAADDRLPRMERWKLRFSLPPIRREEEKLFQSACAVSYNSSSDIAHLRRQYPDAPLAWVPDGCDTAYFAPEQCADIAETDTDLVFVGNMIYPPNADAAIHMAKNIMPHIWPNCPRARAILIGPQPPPELKSLHDGERVLVMGEVPDVRPYLKQAAIVISPVRYGAGMKNKLQSGLAMGRAMVVSSVTAEGFDELEPGRDMLIADEPKDFAAACCRLLADPVTRRAMGASGMAKIRKFYSWEAATERLKEALARCKPVA